MTLPPCRPKKYTGFLPPTASSTSSTICPSESSTVRNALAVFAAARYASAGKGKRVIGRMSPALTPAFRSASTALLAMRPTVPYAVRTISASSQRYVSQRVSFCAISAYVFCRACTCGSSVSGSIRRELSMRRFSPNAPSVAQSFSGISESARMGGNSTGSINCPIMPSPRIMAGTRYLSDRSNARKVRSHASCTDAGASTMRR